MGVNPSRKKMKRAANYLLQMVCINKWSCLSRPEFFWHGARIVKHLVRRLTQKRFGMEPNRASGKTGWPTPTPPEKDETMLVLTRKQGEVIHIGEGIAIKVIKTGKGTVKIGIEAPADVKVLRGELSKKLEAAKSGDKPATEEPKAVLFQKTAGRPVAVEYAGYFALPQTA